MSATWYAEFRGDRAVRAPVTWAQRNMWDFIRYCDAEMSNVTDMVVVPDAADVGVESLVSAVSRLVSRYEGLRTRPVVVDGDVYQDVSAAGRLPVPVVETTAADLDRTAADVLARTNRTSFDFPGDWPFRVVAVTVGGRVRRVIIGFSHFVIDGYACRLVMAQLLDLLLGGDFAGEAPIQPVDLAYRQQTGFKRHTERALEYTAELYRTLPRVMFDYRYPDRRPARRPFVLSSRAADVGVAMAAARYAVSPASVLLAATSVLIHRATGHPKVAYSVFVHNRFIPGLRDMVGALAQASLFAVQIGDAASFSEVARRCSNSAFLAYRYAFLDQVIRGTVVEPIWAERGFEPDPKACVNDFGYESEAQASVVHDEAELRALLDDSVMRRAAAVSDTNCRFCLAGRSGDSGVELTLLADDRCLSPEETEQFLWDLEELVVTAAFRDVSLAELPTARRRALTVSAE